MVLPSLPRTPNGKVDRAALPAPAWGSVETGRVAPRTPTERALAEIWAKVLGVPEVGVEENFFELGGDSILSIQIVSRGIQAGLRLTPKQVFQHPTVAELARVAEPIDSSGSLAGLAAERDAAVSAPLHPIQEWFFEQELPEAHWWNQWVWMELWESVDAAAMGRAFEAAQRRHEALRMRFVRTPEGWRQSASAEPAPACSEVDLRGLPAQAQERLLSSVAEQFQKSLDLSAGPVARLGILRLDPGLGDRLLVAAHHLVIDIVSWTILLEDLQQAYQQIRLGEAVELPAATTTYRDWCERLAAYAGGPEIEGEVERWEKALAGEVGDLPVDNPGGGNHEGTVSEFGVHLSQELTEGVAQEAGRAYQLQPGEALLVAVGRALAQWSGAPAVVVDVEGHGREELWGDMDLTRTVGWFTALYPMRLACGGELGAALKRVKEQVRTTPHGGLGYGLLRYKAPQPLRERVCRLPRGSVSLNYLGRRRREPGGATIREAQESPGAGRSPKAARPYEIEINAGIYGSQLRINWTYSGERYQRATIERLAAEVERQLGEIAAHCRLHGAYTPSDFPLSALRQEELDQLIGEIAMRRGGSRPAIENIYPLSPMQKGMLFHSVLDPNSGVYFVQHSSLLRVVDVEAFRRAWERLVRRHGVLRAGFEWERDEPLQVVYGEVELPWEEEDWRGLDGVAQQERLAELLEKDRREGFEPSRAPLMRVRVIHQEGEWCHVIWSYHHLLLDGWSTARLLEELAQTYDGLLRGETVRLAPPRPYAEYIEWLGGRDMEAAEAFWRDRLRGFTAPTPAPILSPAAALGAPSDYVREFETLSPPTAAAIEAVAAQRKLTLNTLIQGAWALLLSRRSGAYDVVFGATVAGRPPDLLDVENMIGLFINTIPVRARIAPERPLAEWLQALQALQADARQYDYAPLTQIQAWSDLPRGVNLFDTIVVVDNYPTRSGGDGSASEAPVEGFERSNYALTLTVTRIGSEIRLMLEYEASRCARQYAQDLLSDLKRLLSGMTAAPTASVGKLFGLLSQRVSQSR